MPLSQSLTRLGGWLRGRAPDVEEQLRQSAEERERAADLVFSAERELAGLLSDLDEARPTQERPLLQAAE